MHLQQACLNIFKPKFTCYFTEKKSTYTNIQQLVENRLDVKIFHIRCKIMFLTIEKCSLLNCTIKVYRGIYI